MGLRVILPHLVLFHLLSSDVLIVQVFPRREGFVVWRLRPQSLFFSYRVQR